MHTQKNRLPCRNQSGYISAAPHKTGAGISTPLTIHAHNRASGFFVRTVSPRLFRVRIMVGRMGPTSVGPGSCIAGCGNPVRLTTPSFPPLDGEFSKLTIHEATPWQTANNSAHTLRVVTSRLKSIADSPALHIAFIMQSNTLHRLNSTISADYCAAVFSYLAEDLLSLQDLIQQQNKLH